MSHFFSIWFRNLLNNWNILFNSNFNYSLFNIDNLNNFFNSLNYVDLFLYYVIDWDNYLLLHLHNLWNINKIINNFFNLNVFNLLNRNLFNNFYFFDSLDLSNDINKPLLESINYLDFLLDLFGYNRNLSSYFNWNLFLYLLNNMSIDFNNFSLDEWLLLYYLNWNRGLSINNSIHNYLSNDWNLNSYLFLEGHSFLGNNWNMNRNFMNYSNFLL